MTLETKGRDEDTFLRLGLFLWGSWRERPKAGYTAGMRQHVPHKSMRAVPLRSLADVRKIVTMDRLSDLLFLEYSPYLPHGMCNIVFKEKRSSFDRPAGVYVQFRFDGRVWEGRLRTTGNDEFFLTQGRDLTAKKPVPLGFFVSFTHS